MTLGLFAIDVWLVVLAVMILVWSRLLPALMARARGFTPEARARRLFGYALAPWAFAWLSVFLAFLPTWLVQSGWVGDWCLSRNSGIASACPMHGDLAEPNAMAPMIALLVLLLAAVMALRAAWMVRMALAVAARMGQLRTGSMQVNGLRVDLVSSPDWLALSLCLPQHRVVMSSQVAERLSPDELCALIEHERAHLARRDGYSMLVMVIASSILLPAARHALRAEWNLAVELSCDRIAAYRAGPVPLASALIKFARGASATAPELSMATGFAQTDLEARVKALLQSDNSGTLPGGRLGWSLAWCIPLAFALHELGEFILLPLVR